MQETWVSRRRRRQERMASSALVFRRVVLLVSMLSFCLDAAHDSHRLNKQRCWRKRLVELSREYFVITVAGVERYQPSALVSF